MAESLARRTEELYYGGRLLFALAERWRSDGSIGGGRTGKAGCRRTGKAGRIRTGKAGREEEATLWLVEGKRRTTLPG
jgi:hypothetical protein